MLFYLFQSHVVWNRLPDPISTRMAGSYSISKMGGVVEFLNTHFDQNSYPADIIIELYLQVQYLQAHLMGHVVFFFFLVLILIHSKFQRWDGPRGDYSPVHPILLNGLLHFIFNVLECFHVQCFISL